MEKEILRNEINQGCTVAEYQRTLFGHEGIVIKYLENGEEVSSVYVTMDELELLYTNAKAAQAETNPL